MNENQEDGTGRRLLAAVSFLSLAVGIAIGCGGSGSSSPPQANFDFSVNPSGLSVTVGTISPAVVVEVSEQNGFADTVNVAINGLPPGSFSKPPVPLAIPSNGSQRVTFFIPPSAPAGSLSIELEATSVTISHSATLNVTVTPVSGTAVLQESSGQAPVSTIEFQGVTAGNFNPAYWQNNSLNWVPDVREPMFAALTTSPYQNIYAPWPLEQQTGWRMFYGGWDGSDTPNDRVYSVTTSDFLTFNNRTLVIDHGAFQHVNNVNVQQLPDGSLHMMCTGGTYDGLSWPTYFSSPDGVSWNGSPEPYQAQLADIAVIKGYSDYSAGGFNGGNVLFWDNDWVLYFYDNFNNNHIFRATGASPQTVQFQGLALATGRDPNAVVKFTIGDTWYLMGLNTPGLTYSLSKDGVTFSSEQALFNSLSSSDTFIDSVSFVTHGDQLLGVLYGANASPPEGPPIYPNQIYARWLQKKVVITDSAGVQYFAQSSYGPDRQWFQAPASGSLEGTMVVYAEDSSTPLGSSLVTLTAGKSYTLVLQ